MDKACRSPGRLNEVQFLACQRSLGTKIFKQAILLSTQSYEFSIFAKRGCHRSIANGQVDIDLTIVASCTERSVGIGLRKRPQGISLEKPAGPKHPSLTVQFFRPQVFSTDRALCTRYGHPPPDQTTAATGAHTTGLLEHPLPVIHAEKKGPAAGSKQRLAAWRMRKNMGKDRAR